MFFIDSFRRVWSVLILPVALLCLVLYPPPGSGSEPHPPNAELIETDQAIIATQAELDRVLKGYDPDAIAEVGRRLRRLKQRRERISAEIAAARTGAQAAEISQLVRQREGMRRRLADLKGLVEEAAAAFDADPEPARAARLRDLNLELIRLRGDLDKAERAAREAGPDQRQGQNPDQRTRTRGANPGPTRPDGSDRDRNRDPGAPGPAGPAGSSDADSSILPRGE